MGSATYKVRGLVLRKTKLGESDLIVTLLTESGALVQCVAKGARKPGSTFTGRLELFSLAEVLLVKGKSLDIAKEARLENGFAYLREGFEIPALASCVGELLVRLGAFDAVNPRMFPMCVALFEHLEGATVPEAGALAIAAMLKGFAYEGVRPSFAECVGCGSAIGAGAGDQGATVRFSVSAGGAFCDSCGQLDESFRLPVNLVLWMQALLMMPFSDAVQTRPSASDLRSMMQLVQQWAIFHASGRLKSVEYVLSSGVFSPEVE